MQQVQNRELPERISWARALIFAIGFFFLAALLIGQIPGYMYNMMTSSTLQGFEQLTISLGAVCVGGFVIILTIVMLFDPKPVLPPVIFTAIGVILTLSGVAISVIVSTTGNQFFPAANGGFLWFQADDIDLLMIGFVLIFVGLGMAFYSILALQEQKNPDRRDLGVTPATRWLLIGAVLCLILFVGGYAYLPWQAPVSFILPFLLGVGIVCGLGSFALRLHYLMRPVRKTTMAPLYAVGALGLAQTGVILLLVGIFAYPLVALFHSIPGLGGWLVVCSKKYDIPGSCYFSPDFSYLVDAAFSGNFFIMMLAGVWAWKSNRNLVIIGSVVSAAVIGVSALIVHTNPGNQNTPPAGVLPSALMLAVGILIFSTIWTMVARREFAVVGEQNLGCLGQWLLVGTCLFTYLAAFAFFSLTNFNEVEAAPNVPFQYGGVTLDAFVMVVLFTILGLIQFYFLVRNRYKV